MGEIALAPCLVCGKELRNAMDTSENQPSGGTAFQTGGHYGSTAFDPFNGSMLEINVCDECLTAAGEQGRVLWRREAKALVGAPPWRESIFGWVEDPGPYVPWDPKLDKNDGEGGNEQTDLERYHIDSREELLELIERRGIRLYGGVKLNGGFTPEDAWPDVEYADDDES
jgi:hypothetical protein